jgi:hypothetical protein
MFVRWGFSNMRVLLVKYNSHVLLGDVSPCDVQGKVRELEEPW